MNSLEQIGQGQRAVACIKEAQDMFQSPKSNKSNQRIPHRGTVCMQDSTHVSGTKAVPPERE